MYSKELNQHSIKHIKETAQYTFVWFKRPQFFGAAYPRDAEYAVAFTIITRPPYTALALAFLLLRFSETWVAEGEYRRFEMVDLCFHLKETVVYGVMFFNQDFADAYAKTGARANNIDDLQYGTIGPLQAPVSTWNKNIVDTADFKLPAHVNEHLKLAR